MTPSDHTPINTGSQRAVLAVLLSFSSFFLLFAVLSLPWTSVLLAGGGWKKGWWLSGAEKRGPKRRRSSVGEEWSRVREKRQARGSGEVRGDEHRPWSPPALGTTSRPIRRIPIPPGFPVYSRRVAWLNLSVLQIISFLPFALVIALSSSIGSSFLGDATRTGYVALAMLPFVAALSIKCFGLGTILQQGYAAINWLHRWMGRLLWLVVTIHVVAYMVAFARDGTLAQEMKRRVNIDAWISYFGLNLMMLLSLRPVRRRAYQTFKWAHHIGLAFFIGGLNFHSPFVLPFLLCAIIWITANYLYRWTTSRVYTAHISTIPGSRTTLVQIPSVQRGWFPGQHVRIRVFSRRMGWGGLESHPFTVASAENGEGVRLLCKINGAWTQRLHDLARGGREGGEAEKDGLNTVSMSLEGPYGQSNHVLSLFASVLVVAGGSGVSFALSIAESVVQDVQVGKGSTRELVVAWSVREPGDVALVTPLFQSMFDLAASQHSTANISISVLIFCTSPPVDSGETPSSATAIELSNASPLIYSDRLPVISFGKRPPLREILQGVTERSRGGGVVVATCGPDALVSQMGDEVMLIEKATVKRVGGIEFSPQSFVL